MLLKAKNAYIVFYLAYHKMNLYCPLILES